MHLATGALIMPPKILRGIMYRLLYCAAYMRELGYRSGSRSSGSSLHGCNTDNRAFKWKLGAHKVPNTSRSVFLPISMFFRYKIQSLHSLALEELLPMESAGYIESYSPTIS
jgi:hypothetical protein